MKLIIGVIFLVFTIIIGMQEVEKDRATFYMSLNGEYVTNYSGEDSTKESNTFIVTLTGNVKKEGSYELSDEIFLEDLLATAGGVLSDTDYDAFDLNLVLNKTMDIYIAPVVEDFEKVSLNNADVAKLKTLPNIGITLANKIINYRDEIGVYTRLEDVMEVNGIGKTIFELIKNNIIL